jgi:hypothetical protein
MRHQRVQTRQVADDALERAVGGGGGNGVFPEHGTVTLVAGVSAPVSVPALTANSRVFFSLENPNASTTLGIPEAVVTPGTPGTFIVTSHIVGTPGAPQVGDLATYNWEVYEAAAGHPGLPPVNLGTAANYAGIGKAGITNVPTSAITGDLGVSPAAASSITGFALVLDASGQFSTSAQVTGKVFAADYAPPTPALLTQAVLDMEAAYTEANSYPATVTELNAGNLGGLNLPPGVYKFSTAVTIPTNLTLTGGPTDVWVFQIAGTLDLAVATSIILAGGAVASNVFWAVAGAVTLHGTSSMEGEILAQTNIAMQAGATIHGRLLAQTGVTLIQNTVIET